MGNIIDSFFSGFGKAIGKLLGSPLDFLAGKSCGSICGSTWDLICYIENFCISNLLKLAMVSVLFYFVLLFFYLSCKMGIFQCIGRTLCKLVWGCFATCFAVCEYGCFFLCYKLPKLKRKHQAYRRHNEMLDMISREEAEEESFSYHLPRGMKDRRSQSSRRWRDYKGDHLRRSLRPRSHRIRVGISGDSVHPNKRNHPVKRGNHSGTVRDIRMIRTSKFAQKGSNYKGMISQRRRR